MHNCRETKEQLTELLLDGASRRPDEDLTAALRGCAECRAEFASLNATLRITTRLREATSPSEGYWTGYHSRLREKLLNSHAKTLTRKEKPASSFATLRLSTSTALVRFLKSSIPVPAPLGIAIIILCALLGLFAFRPTQQQTVPAQSPVIVRVPVEVPVIHEKVVTQVVYRDRYRPMRSSKHITAGPTVNTFAKSQKPRNEEIPASLLGFKPTDDVKLTVIKGGSQNEK